MRATKSLPAVEAPPVGDAELDESEDRWEVHRVSCPVCEQRIGLLTGEEHLPEHALCPTPWEPFGLTVCQGSGQAASLEGGQERVEAMDGYDTAVLLTLPAGLDWRKQPFSHAGRGRLGLVPAPGRGQH